MGWSEVANMGFRAVHSRSEAYTFLDIATFGGAPSSRFRNWFHSRNLTSHLPLGPYRRSLKRMVSSAIAMTKLNLEYGAQWHEHKWFGTVWWSNNEKVWTFTSFFGKSVRHLPVKQDGVHIALGEHFKCCGQALLCAWCICFRMHAHCTVRILSLAAPPCSFS